MKILSAAVMAASALVFASSFADAIVVGPPPTTTGSGLDCSHAAASVGVIWPPNHTMVAVTILGVTTDPSYGMPAIQITAIQQDELVDALGSGHTAPDGSGIGTSTAMVRAERAGPGTGRYYYISFTASDMSGATCSGMVQTYVPHDQGQGVVPVDTGLRIDSTVIS
jgi:hypothetical protein